MIELKQVAATQSDAHILHAITGLKAGEFGDLKSKIKVGLIPQFRESVNRLETFVSLEGSNEEAYLIVKPLPNNKIKLVLIGLESFINVR
jgi:hypothetical protein